MKGKTAKVLGIILIFTMIISMLAACGSNKAENNKTTDNTSTNEKPAEPAEDLSPITMKFFSADTNPNWNNMQDDVGKVITEKTGVTLDTEFALDDPQKIALIAASGEYPDLISPKGELSKLVEAGAMIDLTDLIDKYGPNIKKVYGDYMKRLRYSDEDKAIYVLPTYAGVDNKGASAGGGFELQHAAVKEAGYPAIRTLQDYENVIKAYKEKHPTFEGKPTIGLTLNADDWHMYISVTNPAFFATGAPDDGEYYINPETYEAMYHFRRPVEKEYFRWLNHMNDIGLLDKESFVQKADQYNSKIASGRVIGLIDQDWDYGDGDKALKAAGKFEQSYGHYPVTLSEEYKDHSFQQTGFMSGWGIGITTAAKDPVRAIKFLDFLASEEGQILGNWGVEGKHYVVEDGKRVIPKEVNDRKVNDGANFLKESGISFYYNVGPHYGDGVKDSTGNYFTTNFPEQIITSYNDVEKEVLAAYKATSWKDLFPKEEEFPVKPWGAAWNITVSADSDLNITFNKAKDITWKRIPQAILAKPDQFDKIWDEYMKELDKVGVAQMEKDYTELVKARVKLWNE